MTTWDGNVFQELFHIPFQEADKLWISFQNKISDFVNTHGGAASVGQTQVARPDWVDIKDVVEGTKPLSYLNKNCN